MTATASRPAVVLNPSKVNDPGATRLVVDRALVEAGLPESLWYETTEADPGRGQTAKAVADGADLVLALGGDGTVRACAAELAGSAVPLAILPAGTGNLLARNLGIDQELGTAAGVAATGRRRRIDLIELDGEPYVVMGGCGFDARLFEETSEDLKSRVGWVAYVVAGARALRGVRPLMLEIVADGVRSPARAVGVVVGNVGTMTAGIRLLPGAVPDDGRLDVAVLTPLRPRDWVGLAARLITRRTPQPYQMQISTACEVTLTWAETVPVEIDGDLLEPRRTATFVLRPGALTVCVPQSADSGPAA